MLDLGALLDRRPSELSGGQRQRGRCAPSSAIPRSAHGRRSPISMRGCASRRERKLTPPTRVGTTTVFVTHDKKRRCPFDRVAVMRDGELQQIGPPMEVYRRLRPFVAGFIGSPSMNFFNIDVAAPGRQTSVRAWCARIELPIDTVSASSMQWFAQARMRSSGCGRRFVVFWLQTAARR